ncbi:MAG: hypothetical protein ACJAQ6_001211 [Arenicella sp.]|jgi:hypothetical protein
MTDEKSDQSLYRRNQHRLADIAAQEGHVQYPGVSLIHKIIKLSRVNDLIYGGMSTET